MENASALDTLCAWGRPVNGGAGGTDAPSAPDRPFGMERVLRRRRDVGGERVTSGTGLGAGGGALKTDPGKNEWTDMRERRLAPGGLVPGGPIVVDERSSASCPATPGADISRRLTAREQRG